MNELKLFLKDVHDLDEQASDSYISTFRCFGILSQEDIDEVINKMYEGQRALMCGLMKHRKTMSDEDFGDVWGIATRFAYRAREIEEEWEKFKE